MLHLSFDILCLTLVKLLPCANCIAKIQCIMHLTVMINLSTKESFCSKCVTENVVFTFRK